MKYFTRHPAYFESFRCSASRCSDNCCIGWEIDIDSDTLSYYMQVQGSFGERLKENIDTTGDAHFILGRGERCPFLNDSNLCDIILTLGEENICQICSDHPRFYEWYSNGIEEGVGLCCEEAARLILEGNDTLLGSWEESEDMVGPESDDVPAGETEIENEYFSLREQFFKDISCTDWKDKDNLLEDWGFELEISEVKFKDLIAFYQKLEINASEWRELLAEIAENAGKIAEIWSDFESINVMACDGYKKIMNYFVYRYFMKARFRENEYDYAAFCILNTLFIEMLDINCWMKNGKLTLSDRINNCKQYSQEIEYCEENVEEILNMGSSFM